MADKYSIDFDKVDAAFQQLASSDKGGAALEQLRAAHSAIGDALKPKLNQYELHYLLTNLTEQREASHGPGLLGKRAAGVKFKSGFFIKTAVPAS